MVNQSRELYERLVVVRYKVYADSILGTKTPLIDEEEVVLNAPIVEETNQTEKVEETPFDFSLFDENSTEEAAEIEKNKEEVSMDFEIPLEEEATNESNEDTLATRELIETPSYNEPVSLFAEQEVTLPFEDVQPEIEIEKKPVPTSNFDEVKFSTPVFNTPIEDNKEETTIETLETEDVVENSLPITDNQIVETSISYTKTVIEHSTSTAESDHPLSSKIQKIEINVRQNYSIVPLDTLIGSFSLNEKLQLINELFGGSSDEFSSSIKRLDAQGDLTSARSILATMAENHSWDLESETTEEFILKVCRRYANSSSN